MLLNKNIKNFITIIISISLFILLQTEEGAASNMVTSGGASEAARGGVYSNPQAVTASQVGSATFTYPIEVPPGRNGLQPNISLQYSSYNGNGWLGVGWDLNMGSISRSNRYTLSYNSNSFVVDGADLVLNSAWGSNYYRTKIEGAFTKYQYISESAGWIAYATDGTKYYYGSRSSDSNSKMTNDYGTFSWHLDKVEDTNGNYMLINYTPIDQGQIYLSSIYYTYHTSFSGYTYKVEFALEDRDDIINSYKTYSLVTTDKLLKTITVSKADDTIVYKYELNYENPIINDNPELKRRSRLTQIQRVDPNNPDNSLPPYEFTYNDGGDGTFSSTGPTYTINPPNTVVQWKSVRLFGDINGDGRQDFIVAWGPNFIGSGVVIVDIYLANINSSGVLSYIAQDSITLEQVYYQNFSVSLGDVDGDGDADILSNGLNFQAHVYLSNGDGTFSGKYTSSYAGGTGSTSFLAELNGDGKADLIVTNGSHNYTYISIGNGYFGNENYVFTGSLGGGPIERDQRIKLGDVNGDGRADLYVYIYFETFVYPASYIPGTVIRIFLGNVYNTFNSEPYVQCAENYKIESDTLVDINGDGLSDLAYVSTSNNKLSVYLSNGTSMIDASPNLYLNTYNTSFADIDDDGMADMFNFDSSNNHIFYKSNGDGTFEPQVLVGGLPGGTPGGGIRAPLFVDMDGDGKFDVNFRLANGKDAADCIKTITNPFGGKTEIFYKNSSGLPNNNIPFIMHPVETIKVYDGIIETGATVDIPDVTSYDYENGYYDYRERDFRGFGYVKKTNADGSTVETTYEQIDNYKKGRPLIEETKGDGVLFKRTTYTWGAYNIASNLNDAKFVKLNSKTTTYENNSAYLTAESYTYDDTNGFPSSVVKSGTDANGQAIEQITQASVYDRYPSNSWTWRLKEETVTGATTGLARMMTYGYDNYGNMTSKTFWRTESDDYESIVYDHDSFGNVTSERDGIVTHPPTTIAYDSTYTFPVTITNPKGHVTTKTWDYRFGKEDIVTEPNGNKTDYDYDNFGRVTSITNKDINNVIVGYTETAYTYYDRTTFPRYKTIKTLESNDNQTPVYIEKKEYFDGLDRSLRIATWGIDDIEQPIQIFTDTTYDEMGRKDKVFGPYKSGATANEIYYEDTDYDKLGRVTFINSPSATQGELSTISYTYPNPFKTVITDPDNKQKTEKRDHLGRIIEVIEHANAGDQNTLYSYNAAGDMIEVENDLHFSTLISYDARGLKTSMDDPDMGEWHYTYDENGNLSTQTDAKENLITFYYDVLNRVYNKIYTIPASEPQNTNNVEYRYDGDGLSSCTNCLGLLTKVNNTSVLTINDVFDAMGRVKRVTKTISGEVAQVTQTSYDLSGKVKEIIQPDGFKVTNNYYPGTGLLDTVKGKPSVGSEVEYAKCTEYEATGKIGRINHAYNDTETIYTYDPKTTRLIELLTSRPGSSDNIQHKMYTYSKAGDIETITDNLKGVTYTYQYDNLHRLLEESTSDTTLPTSAEVLNYTYGDSEHINAVTSINYNGSNYAFSYDANGNMISGYDFTNPGSVVSRGLTWNADNMPITITRGGVTTSLTYDGNGARAKKVAGGTTTYYLSNDYEIKNGVHTKYVFAGNLRVASIDDSDINTSKIYHKDHLGSSVAITDGDAGDIETSEYLPFGGMRAQTGSETTGYKFTDQELDSESGFYNYDARLYDPVIGRFLSADSIFPELHNPQSLNRYSYCINNPLIYHDPNGHDYILLNDPTGAGGAGHNAVLVGSDKNGWTYYSKDGNFFGTKKGNTVYCYDTYGKFLADNSVSGRYSRQLRVETSEKQDDAMNDHGAKNVGKNYSYAKNKDSENCADLASGVGTAGDISVTAPKIKGSGITYPNIQYENLLKEIQNRKNIEEEFKNFLEEQKKTEEQKKMENMLMPSKW